MVGKKAAWSSLTSGTSCTLRTEAQPQSRTIATSQFKRFMVSSEVSTPWTLPECYHSASVRHGENTKGVGTHKHYASSYPPKDPLPFAVSSNGCPEQCGTSRRGNIATLGVRPWRMCYDLGFEF